jgi:enediyne biosynthesis protein E4
MHFGLGQATKAEQIEIRWPNGKSTTLKDVAANQILTVVQPAN